MDYKFQTTAKITELTKQIDQASFFIRQFPLNPQHITNLRRQSALQSSLFSARIEGNPLTPDQITFGSSHDLAKLEVQNLNSALAYIGSSRCPAKLSLSLLQTLHRYVLKNLSPDAGSFRTEQSAIFNQAGSAIYITPAPLDIRPQLAQLLAFANKKSTNTYAQAALTHFAFLKIHPFLDGNGRVGRLITQHQLDHQGKNFHGLLVFEKQIDLFRSEYYTLLNQSSKDLTDFVVYFLEMLQLSSAEIITTLKTAPSQTNPLDTLLPRRREIYLLIQDHAYLSFDQIHRRFLAVNPSTLRNDIRQLIRQRLIRKIGSTRGALYQVASATIQ